MDDEQQHMFNPFTDQNTWFSMKVFRYSGITFDELPNYLPEFDRLPLIYQAFENEYLHLIVRLPYLNDKGKVPVATVSRKGYVLIQYADMLDVIEESLKKTGYYSDKLLCNLVMTEYGERIRVQISLPTPTKPDDFDDDLQLMLEYFNSVDKSTAMEFRVSWFRGICQNGWYVFGTKSLKKVHHTHWMNYESIEEHIVKSINNAPNDYALYQKWLNTGIAFPKFEKWVDDVLTLTWGKMLASRCYHLAKNGYDGDPITETKETPASKLSIEHAYRVHSLVEHGQNLYDVFQVLTWLIQTRPTLEDQHKKKLELEALMSSLVE